MLKTDQASVLKCLYEGHALSEDQADAFFDIIFDHDLSPELLSAALVAMRVRGETPTEIIAGAKALRRRCTSFSYSIDVMDTCGTGGDHSNSYNISTTVAFVLAGAGLKIAKHGGRASSSLSGSSDVLSALGVPITVPNEVSKMALDKAGICFLFAPNHHPVMKKVAPIRQALKIRTIFNLLGPLVNPANARCQMIGVYAPHLLKVFAEAVIALNISRAVIIHGCDGFDEVSLSAPTQILMINDGVIEDLTLNPNDFGLSPINADEIKGGDAEHNAKALRAVLAGEPSAYRDVVVANAACGLMISGQAKTIKEGVAMAIHSLDKGLALKSLEVMISVLTTQNTNTNN